MDKMRKESAASSATWETLETFARMRVQEFIQQLLDDEVTELLGRPKSARRGAVDAPAGVRNGHGKPRRLSLMNGTVTVRRARVRDLEERFVSRLLPLFQRRTPEVSALLPELYLHGLALGDFELALRGLLGDAAPLSASSLGRLKATWQAQHAAWQQRDLSALKLVYLWADGVYVKAGLEDSKAALLVLIGADADGQKQVLAVTSGERESAASWSAVLRDLKARGLCAPKLTIADGHLGIWGAITAIYPTSAEQRCWNHKLRNILDLVPRKRQAEVTVQLQQIAAADTLRAATTRRDAFAPAPSRVAQSRGVPRARLGSPGGALCLSAGTLEAPAHHEHRRIPFRGRPTPHVGRQALQEGRERHDPDLAHPARRRTAFPETERAGPLYRGVRGRRLSRRPPHRHPDPRNTSRRLTPFSRLFNRARLTSPM